MIAVQRLAVYGDSAYGSGELLSTFEHADAEIFCRGQEPHVPAGRFAKSEFQIDLDRLTVTCPAGQTVPARPIKSGHFAAFGAQCAECPLAAKCTASAAGRTIHIGHHERQLPAARRWQADPEWTAQYKATRPKVERKIAHLMRRKHGGRRARVRGKPKVAADLALLAAASNLARLAILGVASNHAGWAPQHQLSVHEHHPQQPSAAQIDAASGLTDRAALIRARSRSPIRGQRRPQARHHTTRPHTTRSIPAF